MNYEKIVGWFEHYQGKCHPGDMVQLYERLIEEEADELHEAIKANDVVELLDAYADLVWVTIGHRFFMHKLRGYKTTDLECTLIFDRIVGLENPLSALIDRCLHEVARSNWTKSLSLEERGEKAGKVVKGDKYEKPNIVKVVSEYYTVSLK